MASSSAPSSSGRVLRSRVVRMNSNTISNSISTERIKKRKRAPPTDSEIKIGDLEGRIKGSLENRGIPVGPKTQRSRLLELLDKYVKPKRTRIADRKQSQKLVQYNPPDDSTTRLKSHPPSSHEEVNFSHLKKTDLVEMIKCVGLDTSGLEKQALIDLCKTYKDLIVLPSDFHKFTFTLDQQIPKPTAPKGLSAFAPLWLSNLISAIPTHSISDTLSSLVQPDKQPDSSLLPSLEHKRFLYPRPRPTVLSSPTAKKKGKSKAQESSEDEFNPLSNDEKISEGDEPDSDDDVWHGEATDHSELLGNRRHPKSTKNKQSQPMSLQSTQPEPAAEHTKSSTEFFSGKTAEIGSQEWVMESIFKLKSGWEKTNERLEKMRDEFNLLSKIVQKALGSGGDEGKASTNVPARKIKTRGGAVSRHVRFHIDTMLGQQNPENDLPSPATDTEKEFWTYGSDHSRQNDPSFELPEARPTSDPCFPYKHGPGHKKSTPQQLSIMWQMMRAVGVSQFRPDFSTSTSSTENRFLWDLALKIFIRLVECGEYTGISLENSGLQMIKKSFRTRLHSLNRRFRQQSWDKGRLKLQSEAVRRTSRLRYIKKLRDSVVIENQSLWKLSEIIDVACSDDETDHEECSAENLNVKAAPCHILKLKWRSSKLEQVLTLLDSYKARLDASIPKTPSSSPSRAGGRPNRPRIRCSNGNQSLIEPPKGLPIDCICEDWYNKLLPKDKLLLKIDPNPILHLIIPVLEELLA
ncbi:hypothetical protein DFH28DRAFT_1123493 [Melampsora americana]|nr:hypothetical protein DFH28DRAFT_1123493 [Melampsora americana]